MLLVELDIQHGLVPLGVCLCFKLGQGKAFSHIWEKAKSDGDMFARQ